MKILIIEDEKKLSQNIVDYLTGQQYDCETAGDFKTASEKLDLHTYDCVLLDINLPGGNGFQLLQDLKDNHKEDAVIIISARDSVEDKIKGLTMGADDYLAKPFHLAELGARIISVLRRKYFAGVNTMKAGDLLIDLQDKTIKTEGGCKLELTPTEFNLLFFLITNKNKVVSKNAIATHLQGDEVDGLFQFDSVYAHIKNLRKKLEKGGSAIAIESRYSLGYKIVLP